MTIHERLQALLDGKAIYAKVRPTLDCFPHRLYEGRIKYLHQTLGWIVTSDLGSILDPEVEVKIYEEPKPEPTAREKRKEFRHKYFSACLTSEQADAIADYIDERLKELQK